MKVHPREEETRTIETRLSHPHLHPLLDELLSYFSSLHHRLWRDLIIKGLAINELKRSYIADFGLTARQFNSLAKKPAMPAAIRGKFTDHLTREISQKKLFIHQKKRRLGILRYKLNKLQTTQAPSLCFGTKRFFCQQYHLESTEISSHEQWLESFRDRRSSQVFFLGSSDETAGNQTVQYNPEEKLLRLRLPNAPQFSAYGTHLCLENLEFPEHLRAEFCATLGRPGPDARKNQKTKGPLSYRIVRRVNPHTKQRAYYLQASFAVEAAEKQTDLSRGAVGVDLNADHVAVTETDRYGNYIDSFLLPFKLKGLSTEEAKAILGDLSAIVVAHSLKTGKALVLEDLDFEEKKKTLRELPKQRRSFLSAFAYAQFQKAVRSKARSEAVALISINPAYTSLIGAYKYQGLKISTHEKAALASARRAQGYSEGLKVFQGTLPTQVMMSERTLFAQGPRHVWRFYGDHRHKIRSLLIEPDKRPLLPILRALTLARTHASLYQSLSVTWRERVGKPLRCSLG